MYHLPSSMQSRPVQHGIQPPPPPPPLHMPPQNPTPYLARHNVPSQPTHPMSLQMQMHDQSLGSEMSQQTSSERVPRPPPDDLRTIAGGRIWTLKVEQQPVRARMCGFGDKDRRPITPPPCIRLIVQDHATGKELDINEIDTSFYVLAVDIWDEHGETEQNIVRTGNGGSPSISTASTVAYSPAVQPSPYAPPQSAPSYYPSPASVNPSSASSYQSGPYSNMPPSAYGYSPNQAFSYNRAPNGYPSTGYPLPSPTTPISHAGPGSLQAPYSQPTSNSSSVFTRNLIGSLSASAFRLHDNGEKMGVWFIMQDLSVRTEGTFRLKFSFINLSNYADAHPIDDAGHLIHSMSSSTTNGSTSPHSSSQSNGGLNGSSDSKALNKGFCPVLAYVFSEPFTVYSAKRFPGVIESTDMSKCFAAQGIKIPIRKDQLGTNGKRRNSEIDDGDENAVDG